MKRKSIRCARRPPGRDSRTNVKASAISARGRLQQATCGYAPFLYYFSLLERLRINAGFINLLIVINFFKKSDPKLKSKKKILISFSSYAYHTGLKHSTAGNRPSAHFDLTLTTLFRKIGEVFVFLVRMVNFW